jgi:hypothetical protein
MEPPDSCPSCPSWSPSTFPRHSRASGNPPPTTVIPAQAGIQHGGDHVHHLVLDTLPPSFPRKRESRLAATLRSAAEAR